MANINNPIFNLINFHVFQLSEFHLFSCYQIPSIFRTFFTLSTPATLITIVISTLHRIPLKNSLLLLAEKYPNNKQRPTLNGCSSFMAHSDHIRAKQTLEQLKMKLSIIIIMRRTDNKLNSSKKAAMGEKSNEIMKIPPAPKAKLTPPGREIREQHRRRNGITIE